MSEFSLPKTQGDIVENIRLDQEYQSLTKRDPTVKACSAHATELITGLHRLYLKDGTQVTIANHGTTVVTCNDTTRLPTTILTVGTSNKRWMWTTWHNIAIGSDGYNQPVKYDGSSTSATYLGSLLATDAGSGSGPTGSDYKYKVSCYSTTKEHIFNQVSNELDMSGNDLTLTMLPICPDTITGESTIGRKIYRNKTAGSTYYLLSNGTIADNSTLTLTDSDADGGLTATTYPAGDETVTPPLGRFPLIHKNRLWFGNDPASNPSRLFYGEDASHDYFLDDSYFNIRPNDGDEITFVKNLLGILTVGKNNTIQKVRTEKADPDTDWEISDPYSFIGNHAPYSAVNTDTGIIYLGNNGIYVFNGQYSQLISDSILPTIKNMQLANFKNNWGAFYKNGYYLTYTSIASGAVENDRMLVVGMIDKTFNVDIFTANVLHVFGSGTDVEALYSGSSASGILYAHTDTDQGIIHNKHGDFTGTWDDARYIPTNVGGKANDPVFEIAWTNDVNTTDGEWTGTIDSVTGGSIIDRPDTTGSYVSQYLTVNAKSLLKLYWNETIPSAGGDVTFDIRSGATTTETSTAGWTTGFTEPLGSDISSATADTVLQYRINMSTTDITYTPNLTLSDGFVVKLTYNTAGATAESTIPLRWRSGWLDFGYPGYVKELRKIYVYYDWTSDTAGTLNLNFESIQGETDSFAIDLLQYPNYYIEYFPDGNMIGELIRLNITEDSGNPITIKKIIIVFDVEADLT